MMFTTQIAEVAQKVWSTTFYSVITIIVFYGLVRVYEYFAARRNEAYEFISKASSTFEVVREVVDSAKPVISRVNSSIDQVSSYLPSITSVARTSVLVSNSISSWDEIVASVDKHPLGLLATARQLVSASSKTDVLCNITQAISLLGIESKIKDIVIGKLAGSSQLEEPVRQQAFEDLLTSSTSWDRKRITSTLASLASLLGVEVADTFLNRLTKSDRQLKAIESIWEKVEEGLNSLGLLNTGKYAYLKELQKSFQVIHDDYMRFAPIIAISPAKFCDPSMWREYQVFRSRVDSLSLLMSKNQCADVRNSALMQQLQNVVLKVRSWDEELAQVRAQEGLRVEPVGVCIQGPSHIGKTNLVKELQKRICARLETLYATAKEEDRAAIACFRDAKKYTRWTMQQRDEYDQGYFGQEIVYCDDGFSDLEHKDHPAWLTFISSEPIGTVQAALNQKGMPFVARLCMVSCNNLPFESRTINNLSALHNRFPICISARKKHGVDIPADGSFDPDFKHLEYHVGKMPDSCALRSTRRSNTASASCKWTEGGQSSDCSMESIDLETIVQRIVDLMLYKQQKYWSQLSLSLQQGELDEESITSEDASLLDAESDWYVEPAFEGDITDIAPSRKDFPSWVDGPLACTMLDNPKMNTNMFRVICAGYRIAPIVTIADLRLLSWWSHLRHKQTHLSGVALIESMTIKTPMEMLLVLGHLEVIPGREKDFMAAWSHSCRVPVRINDIEKGMSILWSVQFGFGKQFLPVPYCEGVVSEFDGSTPLGQVIVDMCSAIGCTLLARLKNTDFEVWRIDDSALSRFSADLNRQIANLELPWAAKLAVSFSAYTSIRNVFMMFFRKVNFGHLLLHDMLQKVVADTLFDNPFSHCGPTDYGQAKVRDVLDKYKHTWWARPLEWSYWATVPFITVVDVYNKTIFYIRKFFDCMGDMVAYALIRLGDLLGIPFNETYERIVRLGSQLLTYACSASMIMLFCSLVYALFRWLYGFFDTPDVETQSKTNESVARSRKAKASAKASLTRVVASTRIAQQSRSAVVEKISSQQLGLVSVISDFGSKLLGYEKEDKPNLWIKNDLAEDGCPFCNEEVYMRDGDVEDLGEYLVKENRWPLAACHKVLFSKEHDVDNPMRSNQFNQELNEVISYGVCDKAVYPFFAKRHWGKFSGGSIPHAHTQYLYEKSYEKIGVVIPEYEQDSALQVIDASIISSGGFRVFLLQVWGNPFDMYTMRDLLEPLNKIFGYPSFGLDILVTGPKSAQGIITIATAFKDSGVEYPLSSLDISKDVKAILVELNQVNNPTEISKILEASSQSKDDTALQLLTQFVTQYQVMVMRVGSKGQKTAYSLASLDDPNGAFVSGVVSGYELWTVAHIASVGDFVKVFFQGRKLSTEIDTRAPYMIYRITSVSELHDLARGEAWSHKRFNAWLRQEHPSCPTPVNMTRNTCQFQNWIDTHVLSNQDFVDLVLHQNIVQWLPMSGTIAAGTVDSFSVAKFNIIDIGGVTKKVLAISGVATDVALTRDGDCGGMVMLMNSKITKKLIGLHCMGTSTMVFSSILTKELLVDLRSVDMTALQAGEIEVINDEVDVNSLSSPKEADGLASLGHLQIKDWPKITWADSDPFRGLILPGVGPDTPVGPCIRPAGRLSYEQNAFSAHMGRRWKHSPFWGLFEEQLVPSAVDVNDVRIEAELPVNRTGDPTLLWANHILAEAQPSMDVKLLTDVCDALLIYFKGVFAGKPIGSTTPNCEDVLDVGLNGVTAGEHVLGLITNSSAGVPWNARPQMTKKSAYIDVDEKGRRTFSKAGAVVKDRCIYKLQQAKKGRRVISFCASKLKDSCVSISAVKKGKTRIFNASAIESVICGNALFGAFKEQYMKHPIEMWHAIGINVNSSEWADLENWFRQNPNHFDVDYSNFDKRMKSVVQRCVRHIIIQTIDEVAPDGWTTARYVLSEEDITSLMVDNRSVYFTEHSNKSGTQMTTIDNSCANMLMVFYCFSKWYGSVDLSFFMRHVRVRSFGDDLRVSVSDECAGFNRNVLMAELAKFGQVATPANKVEGVEITPFQPVEEVSFLKGTSVRVDGIFCFRLEKRSIEGVFNWTQLETSALADWEGVVDSHLMSSIAWGEEYYEDMRSKLFKCLCRRAFPRKLRERLLPYLTKTYGMAKQNYIDRIVGIKIMRATGAEDAIAELVHNQGSGSFYNWLSHLSVANIPITMEEVKQIRGELQADQASLAKLVEDVRVASSSASLAFRKASEVSERVDKMSKTLEESLAALTNSIKVGISILGGKCDSIVESTAEVSAAVKSNTDKLEVSIATVRNATGKVETAVSNNTTQLKSSLTRVEDILRNSIITMSNNLTSVTTAIKALEGTVKSSDNALISKVGDVGSAISDFSNLNGTRLVNIYDILYVMRGLQDNLNNAFLKEWWTLDDTYQPSLRVVTRAEWAKQVAPHISQSLHRNNDGTKQDISKEESLRLVC